MFRQSPPARGGRPSGATFLELLIAAFLVALIALEMTAFFARGRVWFDQEEMKRAATGLAQDAMERVRVTDPEVLAGWAESRTVGGIDYAITVTVRDDEPESRMKTVDVEVEWAALGGSPRSVALATLVYEH